MLKTYLISPPFGNWLSHPEATRVMGSYTWDARPGLIRAALGTVRPVGGGWVNQMGLRNPGLRSVRMQPGRLYSVVGLSAIEWWYILHHLPEDTWVEINLGCSNIPRYDISADILRRFIQRFPVVSIKVSPVPAGFKQAIAAIRAGVGFIHLANSAPSPRGGFSGPSNKPVVLEMVNLLSTMIAGQGYNTQIIAGGGIRTGQDIQDYYDVGASHFSLSTAWFRPLRTYRLLSNFELDI